MVSPYTLLLFGGPVQFLHDYSEIVCGNFVAMQCQREDGILLSKLREQLDSTLKSKINDPSVQWETTAAHVVSAIVKLLSEEGTCSALTIIDKTTREPLTKPMVVGRPPPQGGGGGGESGDAPKPPQIQKPKWVNRECFNCGEKGHIGKDCPHERKLPVGQGGPKVRCFICGLLTHHPPMCPLARPLKK